jgi:hypothetical protein
MATRQRSLVAPPPPDLPEEDVPELLDEEELEEELELLLEDEPVPEELLLEELDEEELLELDDVPPDELDELLDELLLGAKMTTAPLLVTEPAEFVTTTV